MSAQTSQPPNLLEDLEYIDGATNLDFIDIINQTFADFRNILGLQQSSSPKSLLEECLEKIALLGVKDLSGHTDCLICYEPFVACNDPELPIKLPTCGQVIGSHCLIQWLAPRSPSGKNTCPMCRASILEISEAETTRVRWEGQVDQIRREFNAIVRERVAKIRRIIFPDGNERKRSLCKLAAWLDGWLARQEYEMLIAFAIQLPAPYTDAQTQNGSGPQANSQR